MGPAARTESDPRPNAPRGRRTQAETYVITTAEFEVNRLARLDLDIEEVIRPEGLGPSPARPTPVAELDKMLALLRRDLRHMTDVLHSASRFADRLWALSRPADSPTTAPAEEGGRS